MSFLCGQKRSRYINYKAKCAAETDRSNKGLIHCVRQSHLARALDPDDTISSPSFDRVAFQKHRDIASYPSNSVTQIFFLYCCDGGNTLKNLNLHSLLLSKCTTFILVGPRIHQTWRRLRHVIASGMM